MMLQRNIYTVPYFLCAPGAYLIFKVSGAALWRVALIRGWRLFQKLENELKTLHTNWIFFRINIEMKSLFYIVLHRL